MIRGLLFSATLCSIAMPAIADERDGVAANAVSTSATVATAKVKPGRTPIVISEFPVTVRSEADADVSLADFENLPASEPKLTEQSTVDLDVTLSETRALKAWRVGDRLPQITANAAGTYAVRDELGQFRKPRAYKPTAFSTMLVLKIDGKDDTAPFSVGGGGVAGALWKASQQ